MFNPEQTTNLLDSATKLGSTDAAIRASAISRLISLSGSSDPFQNAATYSSSSSSGPLYLGEGNHLVTTGSGDDQVYVGAANDFVNAGNGNNTLYLGEGLNVAVVGAGNNTIYGGAASDLVSAGDGNNTLYLGEGINVAVTGLGNDLIYAGAAADVIKAGNGNNTIYAAEGNNFVWTGTGNDLIYAGAGNDIIFSGAGNDTIYAGEGNNFISAGTGEDTVYVGSGQNQFELNAGAGAVTIIGFRPNDTFSLGEGLTASQLSLSIQGGDTLVKAGDDLLATLKWNQLTSLKIVDTAPFDIGSSSSNFAGLLTDFVTQVNDASNVGFNDLSPGLDAALNKVDSILSNDPDNSAALDSALAELDSIFSSQQKSEAPSLTSVLADLDSYAEQAWLDLPIGDERTKLEAITAAFVAEVKQAVTEGYKGSTLATPTYFANQDDGQDDSGLVDDQDTAAKFKFPLSSQPLIGVIDTGFSGTNRDIDYHRILLGRDRIDNDNNPLLGSDEAEDHGTPILGIIGATRDNAIGINGINDTAPLWLGRAVGSGKWAESLVEFVDAAKASGQPNALINLSFDLVQVNPDGSIATRYQLTSGERAALAYARQNGVIVVAAAGNEGAAISALGQASREFDNIITVGAADGLDRASYSSYGNALDIIASGGTDDSPVISTVEDGLGIMSGTSIAAARVTGAISQVWAANPHLSYQQVIAVIKATATDLKSSGWDAETGAGLLHIAAAVEQATKTTPSETLHSSEYSSSIISSDLFEQGALERPTWKKPSWVKKVQSASQTFVNNVQTVAKQTAQSTIAIEKKAVKTVTTGLAKAKNAVSSTYRRLRTSIVGRPLSRSEISLAQTVFGNAIDYTKVRLDKYSAIALNNGVFSGEKLKGRPITLGNTIKYVGSLDASVLIHELTHVWQYQKTGPIYAVRALNDQRSAKGYDYGGIPELIERKEVGKKDDDGIPDSGLPGVIQPTFIKGMRSYDKTAEKQAALVEDYFRLREAKSVSYTPFLATKSDPSYSSDKYDLPLYAYYVQGVSTLNVDQLVPAEYRPVDKAGNNVGRSLNVGTLKPEVPYEYNDWVTSNDTSDYYHFRLDGESNLNVLLDKDYWKDTKVELLNSGGSVIDESGLIFYNNPDSHFSNHSLDIKNLQSGDYYLRVQYPKANTPYHLTINATSVNQPSLLDPDRDFSHAYDFGTVRLVPNKESVQTVDKIGFAEAYGRDENDYYRFSVAGGNLRLSIGLNGFEQGTTRLALYDSAQRQIDFLPYFGDNALSPELLPGTYYVRVSPGTETVQTEYRLELIPF